MAIPNATHFGAFGVLGVMNMPLNGYRVTSKAGLIRECCVPRGPCPLRRFCCCVYEKRELSFDETFRDICLALSEKQRRGKRDVTLDFLVKPLEEEIRGKVSLEGGRFYVTGADGSIEAHLLSEGWRKLAGEVFRTRPPGL